VVAIERLPTVPDLWETSYGRTLLVKLALVAVALMWGGIHHTFVRPRLERGPVPGRVGRSLLGESTVAVAILLVAAVLVNGAPPPVDGGTETAQPARATVGTRPGRGPRVPSGGARGDLRRAGFLGLHLARRLVRRRHEVRTLDLAPLDDAGLAGRIEELEGDVRVAADARRLAAGADVLVHAAAALPIQVTRAAIRSVNVEGTAVTLAAALEAGVRRVVLVSSTAVYGVPDHHPIHEDDPLVGVGHYGESKIEAERLCLAFGRRGLEPVIVRPKTFVGPERLGVFEILFDWIREGRRIPILGDGTNRYQLPRRRGPRRRRRACPWTRPVAGEALNVGAGRFGTVRDGPRRADRARPAPAPGCARFRPGRPSLRSGGSSSRGSHRSPSGTTGRRTRTRSSPSTRARALLGWEPRLSNAETLCATYDWYLAHRDELRAAGTTHRVPWDQRALGLLERVS
jgi:nucleoside-diphosphate-sugar epimerase